MTESNEAAQALRALEQSRADVAAQYDYPFRRHLAFGVLTGALIAVQGLPVPLNLIGDGLVVIGAVVIRHWDLARTGSFLNGWRHGPTRLATGIIMALVLALTLAAIALTRQGIAWGAPMAGLAGVAVGLAGSYWWQAIYLADLRRGRRT
ncbi:hypothetical protein ACOYW6_01020 [Parablastomonas sp. CN1-191]|uniref:hypothetical protein n=1 Tax=Parablastomonas sp. CN1-191 TaxID=3400908 RepID=UPI003BF82C09